jgi:indole-3-glycerol phosphate synthase
LTDRTYFRGSIDDLRHVGQAIQLPLLRKDFIIDEVQVEEARLAGADAVLLICAALTPDRLTQLAAYARDLGLDVLIEIHNEAELELALRAGPAVLGVNNRDLHSFEVSLSVSERLLRQIPAGRTAIAESGIHTAEDAHRMAQAGARGILVGESLMKRAHTDELETLLEAFRVPLPASRPAVKGL